MSYILRKHFATIYNIILLYSRAHFENSNNMLIRHERAASTAAEYDDGRTAGVVGEF